MFWCVHAEKNLSYWPYGIVVCKREGREEMKKLKDCYDCPARIPEERKVQGIKNLRIHNGELLQHGI